MSGTWPPRMWIVKGDPARGGYIASTKSWDSHYGTPTEYCPTSEAEAMVRIARAEAFETAMKEVLCCTSLTAATSAIIDMAKQACATAGGNR